MPAYRSHTVLEVARGVKAFLKLDIGLVRGDIPNLEQQLKARERKLRQVHDQIREQSQQLEKANELLRSKDQRPERSGRRPSRTDKEYEDQEHELSYEALYEKRIQASSADSAIGVGELPFDTIGRLELAVLTREGLRPADTLVDLGCGTGRLAVHAIPFLSGGRYVGIDIAQAMLDEAQKRVEKTIPDPPCEVSWIHQTTPVFELDTDSVDMICAFSVVNHIEHEDAYSYLKEALRVVRPGGRFVFSCLPIDTERGREVFLKSAGMDLQSRYGRVRHVATSKDLMDDIARLAGWTPVRWYDGDEKDLRLGDDAEPHKFSQSICVLEARADGAGRSA